MINNQTLTILIDSGASHSYIDPKMVESLKLQESSMGNPVWCNWLQETEENLMRWLSHAS